jgi:hypothetical protein
MRTIHYTQLEPLIPGSRHAVEYDVYRREVGGFLARGLDGQFVLIRGEEVLGFWPSHREAVAEGQRRGIQDPFAYEILSEHRVLRSGYNKLCRP